MYIFYYYYCIVAFKKGRVLELSPDAYTGADSLVRAESADEVLITTTYIEAPVVAVIDIVAGLVHDFKNVAVLVKNTIIHVDVTVRRSGGLVYLQLLPVGTFAESHRLAYVNPFSPVIVKPF